MFKFLFWSFLLLPFGCSYAQNVPELMYFKFDAPGDQVNTASTPVGTNPAPFAGTGLTIGTPAQFGSALVGTTVASSNYLNTGWATNLGGIPWTINFWINNIPSSSTVYYLWGDPGNSMRCFVNGAPLAGNMRLTGTNFPTIDIMGASGGSFVFTIVRTVSPNEIKVYKNGVLVNTAAITATQGTGTGFRIGNYNSGGLNGQMDEFRMYNRALDASEVAATWDHELPLTVCTNPPTAGSATALPATPVCPGVAVTLGLSGSTSGSGQTYIWQSSSTQNGTYTDISSSSASAAFSVNPTTTTWYKAQVSCGGNTQPSQSVQVVVSGGLPGGTYTINLAQPTGGTNYQTFADAVNALSCGILGPVIINVAPGTGPYNEQVILNSIGGTSAANTITFNGNGATVSDNSTAVTGERAVFKLHGTDYVTLNDFVINTGAGTYGFGVQLLNDADNNTIKNCIITTNNSSTSTVNYAGIVINSSASSVIATGASLCDNNLVTGNTITGGYAGISVAANGTTSQVLNNRVTKNLVTDFYEYGIFMNGSVGGLIDSNDVSRPTRATVTTFRGVSLSGNNLSTKVSRNRIHSPFGGSAAATVAAYGLYVNACHATAGNENTIANNLVYDFIGGTGNQNGALVVTSDYINFYHNTFSIEDAGASCTTCGTRGFYMQTAPFTALDFRNNIVTINRGGTGPKQVMYFEGTGVTFTSNNNDFYMMSSGGTTNHIGFANATSYPMLTDWQGTGQDNFSFSVDPLYTNPGGGDFKPLSSTIDNIGAPVGIFNDIIGASRSTSSPDPGAYEFSNLTAGLNTGAEALITPAVSSTGCYTNAETVTIRVRNSSTSSINFASNPVTVTTNVSGPVAQVLSATLNTGTLAAGTAMDVPMTGTLNMSTVGVYSFNASTSMAGDVNTANDAMPPGNRTRITLSAGTASATPVGYCNTGGMPVLSASGITGQAAFVWQQSATPGSGFVNIAGATTNPYTVASAITQTTYYRLSATCDATVQNSPEVTVILTKPQITSTTPAARCGTGTVTVSATANPGEIVNWYLASTGGTALATGNAYTASISANTTYYASANTGTSGSAGRQTPFATSTGFNGVDYGMVFDATQGFTLTSVDIYPTSTTAGSITVQLTTSSGTVLQTAGPFTVPVGTGTTFGGGATAVTLPLNMTVPSGTGMFLKASSHTGNIIRDNPIGTNFTYPLPIGTVGNITAGLLSGAVNANTHYYFYNWQYNAGCQSARTQVLARVDDCPTPVTLLNFKGERQGSINKLEWSTSTEINNSGFELQRSVDGISFSKLAFVASKAVNGNSTSPLFYNLDDVRPLTGNGYYRLKQIDKDGKATFSKVVLLRGAKATALSITSVYPNPVTTTLNAVVATPAPEQVKLVITDLSGKLVMQQSIPAISGDNVVRLQIETLSSGTYLLKVTCTTGCETAVYKFVKQ
jgi:hypothetical protein